MIQINPREIAAEALMEIMTEEAYNNMTLRRLLRQNGAMSRQDRAFVTEVVNGTLRNLIYIDHVLNTFSKTKTEKIVPQVFWGGIPGAASQYPKELTFLTFLEQACCFLNFDTNYKNMVGSSDFGIYLTDRLAGVPVRIDLDDYPKKMGWIDNRNKVIIGPSGSGWHGLAHYPYESRKTGST